MAQNLCMAAEEVLRRERDALLELVQKLQHLQPQQQQQHEVPAPAGGDDYTSLRISAGDGIPGAQPTREAPRLLLNH